MAIDPEHTTVTRKSKYKYCFTAKHHGGGSPEDARWRSDVSRDQEFAVFDTADFESICDSEGRLYGVLHNSSKQLRDLGTWQQQMAEFPKADAGVAWHGYPIWATNENAPSNRGGQQMRPAKVVFQKLQDAGLITKQQRKRLYKGQHA